MAVEPGAPDIGLRKRQLHAVLPRRGGEHPQGLGHDLRTDVVPGQNGEFERWHMEGRRCQIQPACCKTIDVP
jgi:hypothetical protein